MSNGGTFFMDGELDFLKNIETFIVNTEDAFNLMELYALRIKSNPLNLDYYDAFKCQCEECFLKAKNFNVEMVIPSLEEITKLFTILTKKNLPLKEKEIEVILEEVQDLYNAVRWQFKNKNYSNIFISKNLPLIRNFVRRFSIMEKSENKLSKKGMFIEDPFDELEGFDTFVDGFLEELDDVFDGITEKKQAKKEEINEKNLKLSENEEKEVENLFLSISSAYLKPVKDFIGELKNGAVSKDWIDICLSSLKLIEDAGTKLSYDKVVNIINRFKRLMLLAKGKEAKYISHGIRAQLLKEYANLSLLLPEVFALSKEHSTKGSRKDTIIVTSLLKMIPGVGPVTRNKLILAGMNTLDKYYMATPKDLMLVSGIKYEQAEKIVEKFKEYKKSLRVKTNMFNQREVSLVKLMEELKMLKEVHKKYKEATRLALYSPEYEKLKNKLKLKRQKVMWKINIILAELEEIRMLEDFKKMIFDRRIDRIEEFLDIEFKKLGELKGE